jgi:competence ComEA-like helix-hairpin-helix protein
MSSRPEFKKKEAMAMIIDLNLADTAALIALPGIGSKLALRIVNFRDKLGGFYSIDQLREIYGLSDSAFEQARVYLKLETAAIKKININTASIEELKAHPYIRYNIANPIVAYRKEHGLFSTIEDLKRINVIPGETFNKLSPYLEVR